MSKGGEKLIKAARQAVTMSKKIVRRRFGPSFEKPCRNPDVVECAELKCQVANECCYAPALRPLCARFQWTKNEQT